ncbi:secretin N-terminal domain-containing protein [Pseudoalteromonas sp. T1lg24]|uniref:secretin N-terminal domain-containing protein n=1 Tax=Pseudoalteromonas sp. T1lg24 TaxID=2077099 RepID=UPI000CF5EDA1|nr:secretin N-terminal domain-containing protein [Pseudoalteromonas sp. T1lg24]
MNPVSVKKSLVSLSVLLALSGCALTNPNAGLQQEKTEIGKSYLESSNVENTKDVITTESVEKLGGTEVLNRLSENDKDITLGIDLAARFGEEKKFHISANALPVNDFINYVFGETLNVSYLVEPQVKALTSPVTLNLNEQVTGAKLFSLTQQILSQTKIDVSFRDGIYYLHMLADGAQSNTAFGFGRTQSSVPNVSGHVLQLVKLDFDLSTSLRKVIQDLTGVEVFHDRGQSLVTLKGDKEKVQRALSLLVMFDSSMIYNKSSALLTFQYIDSKTFIEKAKAILSEEGIEVGEGLRASKNVAFVPIEHLGKVAVFANSDEIVDRVAYWRNTLDKPATGTDQSFFIYHPKFARAMDLGASLAPLIGGAAPAGATREERTSASDRGQTKTSSKVPSKTTSIEGDNIRLVVDDRTNSLIFYGEGRFYQELQPIIKQLDIMPKQVMLEVIIAEVKLTGSFSKGVEYAIKNSSSGNRTNTVSFSGESGFSYSIVGLNGNFAVNLNQKDGLVNVLSRPTLLVRDGVSANISVGDNIPTIGSTTSDPISGDRETTQIEYRKTGVNLTVVPTVNAQGTIIMEIQQDISNESPDGSSINGSPSIFERKISTEVVAGDGQTVILGGLISENNSTNSNAVPLLGSIPVLGHLFRTDSNNQDKTELVVLVTPKIVHNLEDWNRVKSSFLSGLENVSF